MYKDEIKKRKQTLHTHTHSTVNAHLSVTLNLVVESTRSMSIRILYDTYLGMVSLSALSVLKTRAANTTENTFASFAYTCMHHFMAISG